MTNNNLKDQILALFPDNNNFEITASDMRTYVEAIFNDKEVVIIKIKQLSDLAANNSNIYEGSLLVIYNDDDVNNVGIYLSKVNQPVLPTDLIQVSRITGAFSGGFERGGLPYDELKYYLVGDIASNQNNAYICIQNTPIPAGAFDGSYWILVSSGNISVINSLDSSSDSDALSASMGKLLNDTKEDKLPSGSAGYILTLDTNGTKLWQPTIPGAIEWASGIMYNANSLVSFNGFMWKALQTNTGNQPDTSPSFWENVLLPDVPDDGNVYWRKYKSWTSTADYGEYL